MAAETGFWLETPEVLRLFPTFVWKCQLRPEVHRQLNATILTRVHEMRHGLQALGRGEAWQSSYGLHRLEDFGALVSCIDAAVAAVLATCASAIATSRSRAVGRISTHRVRHTGRMRIRIIS